ncbi:MAG: (d)CMP kinase [Propionibacteriaceae bacterium]
MSGATQGTPRRLVVAIDGPSGSGKSSTSRGVASRLGLAYLDTGAMYRAATWLALETGLDTDDTVAVAELVTSASIVSSLDPVNPTILIDGHDVTDAIRDPEVSAAVSAIATNLTVRADLVARQRAIIAEATGGIVAEGRDITTVVAPDAPVRVLLVADPAARVARREAELGGRVDTAAVTDQVIRRDRDDSTVASFHDAAPGVVVLDSTHLSLEEVIDAICALVEVRGSGAQSPQTVLP